MKYIDLRKDLLSIQQKLIDSDGEIFSDEINQQLDSLNASLQDKVNFYFSTLKTLEKDLEDISIVLSKYSKLKTKTEKQIAFYKERLVDIVNQFDKQYVTDVDGNKLFEIKTRPSEVIIVKDSNSVPNKYKLASMDIKIDKDQLKKDIQAGLIEETDNYFIQKKLNYQEK